MDTNSSGGGVVGADFFFNMLEITVVNPVNPKMLINDVNPGRDEGDISLYPEPHFSFVKTGEESQEVIKGTFRSVSCSRSADVGTFTKEMCSSCSTIPTLPSFKKRLLLRAKTCKMEDGKRNLASIRNDYLTSSEMIVKLEEQKAKKATFVRAVF
ncbi:hypothetical protein ACROYT_G042202 [Oculina patagonica]